MRARTASRRACWAGRTAAAARTRTGSFDIRINVSAARPVVTKSRNAEVSQAAAAARTPARRAGAAAGQRTVRAGAVGELLLPPAGRTPRRGLPRASEASGARSAKDPGGGPRRVAGAGQARRNAAGDARIPVARNRADHARSVRGIARRHSAGAVRQGEEGAEAISEYRGAGSRENPAVLRRRGGRAARLERLPRAVARRVRTASTEKLRSAVPVDSGGGGGGTAGGPGGAGAGASAATAARENDLQGEGARLRRMRGGRSVRLRRAMRGRCRPNACTAESQLYLERAAAAAGGLHVGVVELEAGTLQSFHIVDLGAVEVEQAGLIHKDLEAVVIVGLVQHIRCVLESHRIAEARAAAAHHRDPQTGR